MCSVLHNTITTTTIITCVLNQDRVLPSLLRFAFHDVGGKVLFRWMMRSVTALQGIERVVEDRDGNLWYTPKSLKIFMGSIEVGTSLRSPIAQRTALKLSG